LTLAELQAVACEAGLPRFVGKQLCEWLYKHRVTSFDLMTNISQKARERLKENYCIGRTEPAAEAVSVDGTRKYLFPVTISGQRSAVSNQQSAVSGQPVRVYVGDELAAVATPIDSLYFLTIQSDRVGELRFELNGETYVPVSGAINNSADSHHGSLRAPIILRKDDNRPYKIIENDHVVIIRGGERYDVTGIKL